MSEGILAAERVREIQAVAREAVVGHAALARFASVCAGDDVFEKDALAWFVDLAKVGAGQVLVELSESFTRGGGW